jgi:hypothetical protein
MSGPVRILFVEDSRDDVELVLYELRRGGLTPDYWVVDTAEAMRRALASDHWDLIIADHSMPRFDAPGALAVLTESGQDLPFIVVSGHIGENLAVRCMKAGAHDYLTKDDLARLVPAVERELREAEQRRQRREAVRALRSSEERYRLLVENAADVIFLLDAAGIVTFASPSVSRLLGLPPEEVVGRSLREFVREDDAGRLLAAFAETLEKGSAPTMMGLRVRQQDGGWRVVEGCTARLVGPDGSAGIVATVRDITERVQLEEQLHQSQKMEAVGRLAGGVAHDFNNLLTVILGYSNLLLDQLAENELLSQEVDEIRRAAERATGLTQQLLTFSRKQVLSPRPVSLNGVVEGMSDMLRRLLGEDVELTVKLAPGIGTTRVDPGQIEQVVMNLAVNARDAMPEGGALSIETGAMDLAEPSARRRALEPGPYVTLEVSDTGLGMDADTQARLFEPFFTTKEPGKGTGLGLSTVYGIVRQSGGSIFASSEPGRGSCFTVLLPRVADEAEPGPGAARASGELRGDETVLLVEDEALVRNLMSEVLRKRGYRVIECANGREALVRAPQQGGRINLLVTDIVMPGMSGIELSRQLTRGHPELRVLFVSGYTEELLGGRNAEWLATPFLQKPFTPDTLARRVREVLDAPAAHPAARPAARSV